MAKRYHRNTLNFKNDIAEIFKYEVLKYHSKYQPLIKYNLTHMKLIWNSDITDRQNTYCLNSTNDCGVSQLD